MYHLYRLYHCYGLPYIWAFGVIHTVKQKCIKGVILRRKSLKDRFDSRGFSVSKYAKAYGLDRVILSYVLNGSKEIKGTNRTKSGSTRKVFAQLKKDGIWIGPLPWER